MLYPTVYFIGSAIKNIVAFKIDLIKPRIVELCLDFILFIVREVFVVKHIYRVSQKKRSASLEF